MQLTSVAMVVCFAAAGFQGNGAAPYQNVSKWTVRAIDKVVVPTEEAGVLLDLNTDLQDESGNPVRLTRGLYVKQGQVLGRIDDRLAKADLKAAEAKLDVANLEAGNDINVRYASMASHVAKVIWEHDKETNKLVPGAVPLHEVMQHELEYRKLNLQIEQARHELAISEHTVAIREAELDKAQELLDRMTIRAPMEGLVVNVIPSPGEWVQPGERIVEIIRLDKLYVDGQQNINDINRSDLLNHRVTVTAPGIHGQDGKPYPFTGRVMFASPEIMQGGDYAVQIEVDNKQDARGNWLLLPGMDVQVSF